MRDCGCFANWTAYSDGYVVALPSETLKSLHMLTHWSRVNAALSSTRMCLGTVWQGTDILRHLLYGMYLGIAPYRVATTLPTPTFGIAPVGVIARGLTLLLGDLFGQLVTQSHWISTLDG
ncbi:hypothetical protein KIPB_010877 [Kipferlia bialata]|uniref:Uncharacterized protein n=1 Tax=Kipferlia bialata TaxID=797122 RepID=A0A391NYX1_9EUKA|nr:hypothetical protein KIPB_010877 [Kipferlia bialata]|eukprot:g10877.t1